MIRIPTYVKVIIILLIVLALTILFGSPILHGIGYAVMWIGRGLRWLATLLDWFGLGDGILNAGGEIW